VRRGSRRLPPRLRKRLRREAQRARRTSSAAGGNTKTVRARRPPDTSSDSSHRSPSVAPTMTTVASAASIRSETPSCQVSSGSSSRAAPSDCVGRPGRATATTGPYGATCHAMDSSNRSDLRTANSSRNGRRPETEIGSRSDRPRTIGGTGSAGVCRATGAVRPPPAPTSGRDARRTRRRPEEPLLRKGPPRRRAWDSGGFAATA
jgi:hypothetical protein